MLQVRDDDAAAFEERAACFVDQYSGYTAVGDVKVNGKRVNIASYRCKAGDVIEIKEASRQLALVLEAAALAPDLPFRVVGNGQLDHLFDNRPANVEWIDWVEYDDLPDTIREAGCALGVFGTGDKTARVIPNKAFQAIACGRPLVTGDTAAARELLTDDADALLVPPGDPGALVTAVRRLRDDPALSARLAAGGRHTYETHASERVLGLRWRALLERLTSRA